MEIDQVMTLLASVLAGVGAGVGTGVAVNKVEIRNLKDRLDRHAAVHADIYKKIWHIINQ